MPQQGGGFLSAFFGGSARGQPTPNNLPSYQPPQPNPQPQTQDTSYTQSTTNTSTQKYNGSSFGDKLAQVPTSIKAGVDATEKEKFETEPTLTAI